MPDQPDHGRNVYERVGALEQDMAVHRHRLAKIDQDHGSSPHRLTKLEQQFEFQTKQLQAIGETQALMVGKVDKLGRSIAYGLGAAAVILALFDKAWPFLVKGFGA
ncbi:hypothetical protein [Pseudomonas turukhanskensis]|uniref:Uncharacterized protein n=1 Tax=Pseudomonas turukhanskensis TaxID=1806536 RepID=A0A9W6K2K2_9PSED|nr:hypothetical protein [Pseudomonas turukhanskensis]GLK88306.1 hypothetical protein GCM10017655_13680 [Pseudomonas turukhanskensis]